MELKNPKNNRPITNLPLPIHKKLPHEEIFDKYDNVKNNWEYLMKFLLKEGRLHKETLKLIFKQTNKLFINEPNLLYLQDPICIIGDIHGQYFDLPTIINLVGKPDKTKYLFLGDYVDRGTYGIECLILIFVLKLNFPNNIFLLRGNHECRELTSFFNFRLECLYKYDEEIYDIIMDTFDHLPLAAIINGKYLALHGGISPEVIFCTDINKIDRLQEPPKQGILCDTLWADPVEDPYGNLHSQFVFNESRGCSYFFGYEAVNELLKNNELLMVIRAHEAQIDGFKAHLWGKVNPNFPQVMTIFSAPNYCGCYGNKGAIIRIEENKINIEQFSNIEHPYFLPNFSNVFAWSLPFVAEKIYEMGYTILRENLGIDDNEIIEDYILDDETYKALGIKKPEIKKNRLERTNSEYDSKLMEDKIELIEKEMNLIQKERRESEKQVTTIDMNGSQIELNILDESLNSGDTSGLFQKVKNYDLINEKRPEYTPFKNNRDSISNKIIPDNL